MLLLICILIPIFILALYIVKTRKHQISIEKMVKTPLYIFPPPVDTQPYGYITYENLPYNKLCPSVYSEKPIPCNKTADCGPGEVCAPGTTNEYNYCICYLANDCLFDGVC